MFSYVIIKIIKFINKIKEDDIFSLSAQFSYYIILGIFPFLFMFVSVLGHYSSIFYDFLRTVENIIPKDVYAIILRIADDSVGFSSTSYLSFSIITLIWSASSGSVGIIKGINKAYNCTFKKNYIIMRLKGLFFTFTLIFSLQLAFVFIVAGKHLFNILVEIVHIPSFLILFFTIIRYIVPIVFLTLIFSFTYKFLPYEKVKYLSIIPGAIFATIGWIIGSFFFAIYISTRSVFYDNIYGSMSGVFIFVIWIYLLSFIFLLGAEFNAFLQREKLITNKKK